MRKILFFASVIASSVIIGCSNDDSENNEKEEITHTVKFDKSSISLKYGESILIGISKPIKDCNFSINDNYYISISVNGDEAKLNALKVGNTFIYAEYKGAKDTCLITVKPETSHFGSPLIELGISRDSVRTYMKNYQGGGTIGGYTGLNYNFNANSKVYYQFDSSDKLVAIKQILKRSNYTVENIIKSIEERFNYISSSSTVYWYSHKNVMTVRIEKTVSEIIIHYAKDATVMYEHFPWD